MAIIRDVIEFVFSTALFINALLFIPQIIRIVKTKSAKNVSLTTFLGFLLIQIAIILHGIITHDVILIAGYLISVLACGTVVILIIIFDKKDKEEAYISAEEILEQLPEHIYWKNKDGKYLGCNFNNAKDSGVNSSNDIVGKTDYDLFAKAEAENLRITDLEVMDTGCPKIVEEESTISSGEKKLYLSHKTPLKNKAGNIVGIIGTSIDITSAKKAVEDHFGMLENIIAIMPGTVYWMNRDGVYLGCNDNEAKAIGLKSRQDIIGKRNIDIPGFLVPEVLDPINQKIMQTGESLILEEPARLPNGTMGTFLSSKVPLKNKEGDVIGLVGISFDITDRKKAELGEFAAQVAHDIRSPLQVLEALSATFKQRFSDEESRIFTNAVNRINETAADLLTRYRTNKTPEIKMTQAYPLWLLLKKVCDEKVITLPNSIKLVLSDTVDKTISADIDIIEFQRIISNIINNAVEAFNNTSIHPSIILSLSVINKQAIIEIRDNGKGIDAARVAKFNQAGGIESHGGHGLGLSHACHTVQRWKGDLKMESTLNVGTTLKIYLPTVLKPFWLCVQLELPKDTVFYLVDDDEVTRHRLTASLSKKGISQDEIILCTTLEEFIQHYEENSAIHKFVFMDNVFIKTAKQGVDIIIEKNLQSNSVLITNDYLEKALTKQLTEHNLRLLPKPLFDELTIKFYDKATDKTETPEYVVLDDLKAVTDYWKLKARSKNIAIKVFNNSADFMNYMNTCDKDTKCYIDNDINEAITGLELTEKLGALGFTQLYMMTSRDDIDVKDYPWLTAVVGKKAPFDE